MTMKWDIFRVGLALLAGLLPAAGQEGLLSDPLAADAFELFPVGEPWENVRVPKYDDNDVLQSILHTDILVRESSLQLRMEGLTILILQPTGKPALKLTTAIAAYNLTTSRMKSRAKTLIEHQSFDMTGDRMDFDTKSQSGALNGNVEMIIYDLGDIQTPLTTQKPASVPADSANPEPEDES